MAKYTITIKTLLKNNFNFGLQNYPIFDENYRKTLNDNILNFYYENEIVKLTINPISQGYEIQDVSLLDSTDNSLDYQIVNNKYELVIPSDGIIKVNASVIGKAIKGIAAGGDCPGIH